MDIGKSNQVRSEISTERSSLDTLINKNHVYTNQFEEGSLHLKKLEQELDDLLLYKKKILEEYHYLEELIDKSNKVQFSVPGHLEGHFLRRINDKISDDKKQQYKIRDTIHNNLDKVDRSIEKLEQDLENQRQALFQLDQLIADNSASIQLKRTEITKLEGQLRSLS